MSTSSYPGPVLCMCCGRVMQAARPGAEALPPSHGLGRCCWASYRAESGLREAPYPVEAGGER